MRPLPWRVKGVPPGAREAAREAAHQSGVSLGAWLHSLIIKAAEKDILYGGPNAPAPLGVGPLRHPRPAMRPDQEFIAFVNRQIDQLKCQIDILSRDNFCGGVSADVEGPAAGVQAIARKDCRLGGLRTKRRASPVKHTETRRNETFDRPLAEITARRRASDGEIGETYPTDSRRVARADKGIEGRAKANSDISRKLQDITVRIKALQGYKHLDGRAADFIGTTEHGAASRPIDAVEDRLRRLTRVIETAQSFVPPSLATAERSPHRGEPLCAGESADTPRQDLADTVCALKHEVRALSGRFLKYNPVIAEIDRSLGDLRGRRGTGTADDAANLTEIVKTLPHSTNALLAGAPGQLQQLDDAIGALQNLAVQMASPADFTALSREVHALSEKIGHSSGPDVGAAMMMLAKRLDEMAASFDRGRAESVIPADFEAIIKRLADRLELLEIHSADQGALKTLEGQIVGLVAKLDASKSSLSRVEGTESSVDRVLEKIDELGIQNENTLEAIRRELIESTTRVASAPAEAIRRDLATLKELQSAHDQHNRGSFEAVCGTIELLADRLAAIEKKLGGGKSHDVIPVPAQSVRAASGAKPLPHLVADARAGDSGDKTEQRAELLRETAALVEETDQRARPDTNSDTTMTLDRRLAEMAVALNRGKEESLVVPADLEIIIKRFADQIKSLETQSGGQDGCELERAIIGTSAGGLVPTRRAVPSLQTRLPKISDQSFDAPLEPDLGAGQTCAMANAIDPVAAS
jgi:hypothetical protein